MKMLPIVIGLLIPNVALAQQMPDGRYTKTVPAGTKLMLKAHYSINVDCSAKGEVTVRPVEGPSHGRLSTHGGMDFPYSNVAPYNACNTKRVKSTQLWYTPDKGYVGPDALTVESFYPDGKARKDHYELVVK